MESEGGYRRLLCSVLISLGSGAAWGQYHNADTSQDHAIGLGEVLRVIQFYNSGGLSCGTGTEDGYAPGPGDTDCAAHNSDYNPQDWDINLSELLRLIQFYNAGGYAPCSDDGAEDGYCPAFNVGEGDGEPVLPVLYLGLMVHLEGHRLNSLLAHTQYRDEILAYNVIFNAHNAKVTWEVKEPIDSCITYNDPYFKEIEESGQGVGVHADLGGNPALGDYTYEEMVADLIERKQKLEWQGVTVRHVSGVCSPIDWTDALADAGFLFMTGGVSYCLMSLPEEDRPEAYRDCQNAATCHDPWPDELADRLHPWRMSSENWTMDDPNGRAVILQAGDVGLIHLADDVAGGTDVFTEADIDAYIERLELALALVDPARINMYYVSWSFGAGLDEALLAAWLERVQPYIDTGQAAWKTLPEIYDLYVDWDATHR